MTFEQFLSRLGYCNVSVWHKHYFFVSIHHQQDDDVTSATWRIGKTLEQQSKKNRAILRRFAEAPPRSI